jgi:ABC-type xylose transport system permease subunit
MSGLWALIITALLAIVILWGLGAAFLHLDQVKSVEGLGFIGLAVAIVVVFFYLSRFLGNEWQIFKQKRATLRQTSHEELANQPFYISITNGLLYFFEDLFTVGQKVLFGFIGIVLTVVAFGVCVNFLFVERDGSMAMSFFNLVNSRWAFTFEGVTHGLFSLNIPVTANFRNSIIWWVILVAFFHIILTRTRYGNAVFATGGNTQAARAQGINVTLIKVQGFMLTAFLAGLAAILETSRSPSVDPTEGTGWELETIAMTVVGGALLSGGYGSVIGTMLGTLIFGMLATGLVQVNLPNRMFEGVVGVIMIGAVILNNITKRRS